MAFERRGLVTLDDKSYPDYWARMGWTNTVKKLNIRFDVAFFGNSITCGSDFQAFFPDKKIINLGYPGDNMTGMLRRVPMLVAAQPKKIFIMAGTNDLVHISLAEYQNRYEYLLTAIRDSLPKADIIIQSVLPSNHDLGNYATNTKIQQANELAKILAGKYDCKYVSLYDLYVDENNELRKELTKDGVHLYPQHYDRWADAIKYLIYN